VPTRCRDFPGKSSTRSDPSRRPGQTLAHGDVHARGENGPRTTRTTPVSAPRIERETSATSATPSAGGDWRALRAFGEAAGATAPGPAVAPLPLVLQRPATGDVSSAPSRVSAPRRGRGHRIRTGGAASRNHLIASRSVSSSAERKSGRLHLIQEKRGE